ncbi:MAG: tripartite tricarboxylate transporter TctB family protein [Treponema sp.]|nr:tripartite tricarboxylate transporter TctB family protein [Spirochaetia bacterium]MDD7275046.1 tripartite tricarboxylate transporter TctB family protein [Treponema sp.]MDY3754696.1 tripartite tricarboxylate transporter TctB family protein [Treponema sp.]MDY4673620.1 tripartite tricarboxylate transporter TctB family protein [Treponema sp.]
MAREFFQRIDSWLDATGEKLEKKKIRLYVDIITPIIFIIFAVAVLLAMPSQIALLSSSSINERSFPTLLMFLIIICGVVLLGKEIFNIVAKKKVNIVETTALVEVKALIILGILVLYWLLMGLIGFIISSILLGLAMLMFFRVKKPSYYIIVSVVAVLIGVFFRYVLNVRLP